MIQQRTRTRLAPWVAAVIGLGAWAAVVSVGEIPPFMLPSPASVAARLAEALTNTTTWSYTSVTATEAFGGSLLGAIVALPWLSRSTGPLAERRCDALPGSHPGDPGHSHRALLVIWVGYGRGRSSCCAASWSSSRSSWRPWSATACERIPGGRRPNDGAVPWRCLARGTAAGVAVHPGGRPERFTLSVTGAVVGEMVMGGHGLGTLLTIQLHAVDTVGMFATITILATLASLVYTALQAAERRSRIVQSLQGRSS